MINDKQEIFTTKLCVTIEKEDAIKVKAVGDTNHFRDSAYSKAYVFTVDCTHVDGNDDGYCDVCRRTVCIELSFYAINDLHGKYMDTSIQPGVDELTTYFKTLYEDNSTYEILFSTGDMWQGTVESSLNKGKLMTTWMNELNFASMTLGNHEFDWGTSIIEENSQLANFPFLAINVRYQNEYVDFCQNSVVLNINGIKIGVIGAVGDCLNSISGEYATGLSFITGDELTELVMRESIRLREEEACKLVIYTLHDGYHSSSSSMINLSGDEFSNGKGHLYYDTVLSNGYVDFVFEGHTHQNYMIEDEYGVYHLQGGGENQYLSCIHVSYNRINDTYKTQPETISKEVYGNENIEDHEVVEEIFHQYFPTENPYTTYIGSIDESKYSDEICQKLSQLYLEIGKTTWGSEYDIVLGGGFLNTRSPYQLPRGDITIAQLFSILPFDNAIVLGKISGEKLKSQFIHTTNRSYYCTYNLEFTDQIYDNQYYYIIVDTYTANYRYNGIIEVKRLDHTTYARDILKKFIEAGGWSSQHHMKVSVIEAKQIGSKLKEYEESKDYYYITGSVTQIENEKYGNFYLKDEFGDIIYIYRSFDETGKILFGDLNHQPKVGNTITIKGKIKKYVDQNGNYTIEMINVRLIGY